MATPGQTRNSPTIQKFAENGVPESPRHINVLEGGVWEFKRASKRVTFYDTDGNGNCLTLRYVRVRSDAHRGSDDEMWRYPNFERQLRLGHCFGKTAARTDDADIEESIAVQEEDLTYDRAA
jgi:hypothetical protein